MHGSGIAITCVALLALMAAPARASHYTVDAAGGGDFTTITAAIHQHTLSARDSILVAPGSYADTLAFNGSTPNVTVLGTGGAAATSAASIAITTGKNSGPPPWRIEGLTFTGDVVPRYGADFHWCSFLQAVSILGTQSYGGTNFHDCDLYGPTLLSACGPFPYRSVYERMHFHAAPLSIGTGGYTTTGMSDCTFEGPAGLLVNAGATQDDGISFVRCSFSNAAAGVSAEDAIYFDHCTAHDITGVAIGFEETTKPPMGRPYVIHVSNSRFERCGSAVRWLRLSFADAYLTADTVYASTGDAITVSEDSPPRYLHGVYTMNGVIVEGGQGHGIVVQLGTTLGGSGLAHCRVRNVAGDGFHFNRVYSAYQSSLWDCQSDHNGGAGFRMDVPGVDLYGNVAWANGGDGFEASPSHNWVPLPDTVLSNTSVGNGGAGFNLQPSDTLLGHPVETVRNNLAVGNTGIGMRIRNPYRGTFAFNDVWDNAGGTYDGVASPADSNLVVNPLLCNLAAGDFGLQDGSPCAPSGPYGLIGARPVGCTAFATVPPPVPALAFAVRPNPARGTVEFAAPAGGGRIEVVDLQGRRVWGGALRAGETLRWDGDGAAGRVPPGIYLVRFRGAAGARTVRLAWIE